MSGEMYNPILWIRRLEYQALLQVVAVKSLGLLVVAVLHFLPEVRLHRLQHVPALVLAITTTEQCQPVQIGLAMVLFQQVIPGLQRTSIVQAAMDQQLLGM